jgi:hypothetical protein
LINASEQIVVGRLVARPLMVRHGNLANAKAKLGKQDRKPTAGRRVHGEFLRGLRGVRTQKAAIVMDRRRRVAANDAIHNQ